MEINGGVIRHLEPPDIPTDTIDPQSDSSKKNNASLHGVDSGKADSQPDQFGDREASSITPADDYFRFRPGDGDKRPLKEYKQEQA
jgi:hypothetical protein